LKILDRLYLNFYWCWNSEKGGELKDASLEKVIMIILWSITIIILSVILSFLKIDLIPKWHFIISAFIPFFLARRVMKKYYTADRKQNIINRYDEPGNVKYLVFVMAILGAAGLLILSYLLISKI